LDMGVGHRNPFNKKLRLSRSQKATRVVLVSSD
jgi:hypothetical protein